MNKRTLVFPLIATFVLSSFFQVPSSAERLARQKNEQSATAARVPAPEDVLGFRPGDDRKLASWASVVEYFKRLDEASDRVKFEELGRTTMGAPFVMATISAPENLRRLDEFKEIQRQLADPRYLGTDADRKARQLIARGKTIVLITCGIHSTEVGSYLSSMLIAHRLASSTEPEIQDILRNCIILLVPSLNPDGVDIVKNWYDKTLGTPYEGTDPPELYHKYTGHDDNRDWYAFTQVETRLTVDKIHNVWHPQIVNDIHQQGAFGSRLFLPPYMQPVEPNVPKQIVEGYTELGGAISVEMRAAGFKGITWDSTYDAWSPSRAYSHYHGGVRILSETASAKLATPMTVKFDELGKREGYDARTASPNFPDVWPGGEWHLRDITNYMRSAAFSLLKHAAQNRERWLTRFYEIGKEAVRPGKDGEVSAYTIPRLRYSDHYATDDLLNILHRGGVEIYNSSGFTTKDGIVIKDGDYLIPLAQPYGAFAKALLERQHYPDLRNGEGQPIAPYDVTAHTLPLLMGVTATPIKSALPTAVKFRKAKIPSFIFAISYSTDTFQRPKPRLALYKSHVPAIDEGWTRQLLENHGLKYSSLEDQEIHAGNLRAKFDVIVIPDQSPRATFKGYSSGSMPPALTGGLGLEGSRALREFVEKGGTLICLNRASDFAIEQLKLPVRDITEGLKRTEFYVPGSILRTELDTSHPIAPSKVNPDSIAWVEESPVFELSEAKEVARVRVIARYPATSDPLLSGWLLGGERIKGKAALVEVTLGKGRIYLFGFRPQYRGQSLATYPLFFNAITQTGRN
jgi:hypothetical protein